ncbi:branched-subunit amino acid transport protein AzlD [Rhodoglobus vestalii]|uniref:Branched-subunit amino acid transport protein AzlD n=1 Tax=Rhodoglobus vestalii TaxID=193384 RepID=A0A8H2PYE0_9MICO|nr:AzlD domain-containing protein [Rhodoglobus vestalii]TQO21145.1 branched-subunit amino acid transport protein AzlD [Rhodoglobus vestalii]
MTIWHIVLLASIAVLALKLAGFAVPAAWAEKPTAARLANLLTVALLSALVVVQTFGSTRGFEVDARLPAIALAAVLFALRVPFILVIIAAALVAAAIRAFS